MAFEIGHITGDVTVTAEANILPRVSVKPLADGETSFLTKLIAPKIEVSIGGGSPIYTVMPGGEPSPELQLLFAVLGAGLIALAIYGAVKLTR